MSPTPQPLPGGPLPPHHPTRRTPATPPPNPAAGTARLAVWPSGRLPVLPVLPPPRMHLPMGIGPQPIDLVQHAARSERGAVFGATIAAGIPGTRDQ